MSVTPETCTSKCDLINPVHEGKEKESWYCRSHKRGYWPNRPPQPEPVRIPKLSNNGTQNSQNTIGGSEPVISKSTIDWLIDEIAPNKGNSPLINFNKERLRQAINNYIEELLGEDEVFKCGAGVMCDNDMCCDGRTGDTIARNQLRQEIRNNIKQGRL
jgi:hypothetical protein